MRLKSIANLFVFASLLGSAFIFLNAGVLQASSFERTRADYLGIRDNSDLFVGEGAAWLKDEGDDLAQATAIATARARGSLAQAIEVRVQSSTEVEAKNSPEGSTETARQRDVSSSDLKLAYVKTQAFEDFPKRGQVTILAWVSKEDWRRQMKGKGPVVYRPENGIRLGGGSWYPGEFTLFPTKQYFEQHGFELGLVWAHWVVEGMFLMGNFVPVNSTDPPTDLNTTVINLGYEWAPFAWRIQPFVPVGLSYAGQRVSMESGSDNASNYGVYVGLGARYWPSDSFALEVSVRQYFPLNRVEGDAISYDTNGWQAASFKPVFELSGGSFAVQVLWSAF